MGRKNRQRKPEPFKCCETCANMQPIGEGDHICDACCSHDGSPTALVLESYIPADDYFICGGGRSTRSAVSTPCTSAPASPAEAPTPPATPGLCGSGGGPAA